MDDANGTQTTFPNNSVSILELSDHSAESVKYGIDFLRTDTNRDITTDREENVVRDIDTVRDTTQELLTEAQRDEVANCAARLTMEVCNVMFADMEELKTQADKIFDAACNMESKLREEHKAQIEDAKCQFYESINREFVTRARIAGSSRNSFVVQQQDRATCDMLRKLASLQAELATDAVKTQQTALVAAHATSLASRSDAATRVMQAALGLWSILKGALATTNDVTNVDDVANSVMNTVVEDETDQTRTNLNWVRQVNNTAEQIDKYTPSTQPIGLT